MNKTIVITTIILVAVIMGMSAMAPAMAAPPIDPVPPVPGEPPTPTQEACDDLAELLDRLIDLGIIDEDDKTAVLADAGC